MNKIYTISGNLEKENTPLMLFAWKKPWSFSDFPHLHMIFFQDKIRWSGNDFRPWMNWEWLRVGSRLGGLPSAFVHRLCFLCLWSCLLSKRTNWCTLLMYTWVYPEVGTTWLPGVTAYHDVWPCIMVKLSCFYTVFWHTVIHLYELIIGETVWTQHWYFFF